MIQLDGKIDEKRLRQFASQVKHIPPHALHVIHEMMCKDQSPEFYHGQMAALQFAHQLMAGTQSQNTVGATMAVVAKHIVDNGWW